MCSSSESAPAQEDLIRDDKELVSRIRNGADEAFETLRDKHKRPL